VDCDHAGLRVVPPPRTDFRERERPTKNAASGKKRLGAPPQDSVVAAGPSLDLCGALCGTARLTIQTSCQHRPMEKTKSLQAITLKTRAQPIAVNGDYWRTLSKICATQEG
jgi:hypothetical protein